MNNLGAFILQTTTGGASWTGQSLQPTPGPNAGIESLSLLTQNTGWAVGWQGRVYKLSSTVSVATAPLSSNSTPEKFGLAFNQPNPVRVSTRFAYTLSAAASIRLAIYDVLGREVALLFSGEKAPGVYSVFWEGRDQHNTLLPNGIYFYRLQAGDFMSTRKLVILR